MNESQQAAPVQTSAGREVGELLTLQQASRLLHVHPNTLRNWERSGLIPVVRVGPRRDRRFPKHGIHRMLPPSNALSVDQNEPLTRATKAVVNDSSRVLEEVTTDLATAEPTAEVVGTESAVETETPQVTINVPAKQRIPLAFVITSVIVIGGFLFVILGTRGRMEETTFAIRRNAPKIVFSDDFEAYDPGVLPRPSWNTFGLWKVVKKEGQRVLQGGEAGNNPLGVLSHAYTGSSSWKDYRFNFNARVVSGSQTITALVNYLDERNYYSVIYRPGRVTVSTVRQGNEQVLGEASLSFDNPADWNTFTIDLYGESLDVLFGGVRVLGVADAALTTGKIGFVAREQVVEFDHVQVIESDGMYRLND